jgi:hypothetical protein
MDIIMCRVTHIYSRCQMKSFFSYLLYLAGIVLTIQAAGHSIVFVHIGKQLPEYMHDALEQARLFNSCDIYLLANQQALSKGDFSQLRIKTVALETLKKTTVHQDFLKSSTLDPAFRDGFWYFTSERFFYLDDFMQQYNMKHVFHVENDNMLYVDLQELQSIFMSYYPNIAAVFDNDERCIPSFIYFSNKRCAHSLAKYFLMHAAEGKNDMQMVALFRKAKGSLWIDLLPIIPPSYATHHALKSDRGHTAENGALYSKNFHLFNSIFDAAALGQYLGGIDPRNGLSIPGFINESCLFNPSHFRFIWMFDERGRRVPYLIFNNEQYRINNLHIHSKKLKEFSSRTS